MLVICGWPVGERKAVYPGGSKLASMAAPDSVGRSSSSYGDRGIGVRGMTMEPECEWERSEPRECERHGKKKGGWRGGSRNNG